MKIVYVYSSFISLLQQTLHEINLHGFQGSKGFYFEPNPLHPVSPEPNNGSPRGFVSDAPDTDIYHPLRPMESPQPPLDCDRFENDYVNYESDLPGLKVDHFHFKPNPGQSPHNNQQLEHSPPPLPGILAQDFHNDLSSRRAESPRHNPPERSTNATQFRRIYHPLINGV